MADIDITGGTIKYGRTIKTAEFENKRGDVELSFNIPEGENPDHVIDEVKEMARSHLYTLLGIVAPGSTAVVAESENRNKPGPRPGSKKPPKAAEVAGVTKLPVEAAVVDPSAVVDEPPVPAAKAQEAAVKAAAPESLDDVLGPAPITDADLTSATTRCQDRTNNSVAIRKLINEGGVKTPPGRLIEMPQANRQAYLDGLHKIKPLA